MSQPHRYPQDSVFHCMKKYIHKAAFKIILPAFDVQKQPMISKYKVHY